MLLTSNSVRRVNNLTDSEVWDQLRTGDQQALEYLYRSYAKDLFNFGMKLYGRNEWVQDTLQELFVDIWKQHQKLSAVTSVKTYLFKALKYKLHRQYGKEKCLVYNIDYERLPGMEVELPEESRMISAQFSREQQLKLAKAIEKLPARQREVLHLLFDEGMSYDEVAGIMEINVRSVYTVAWKAISSLRRFIIDFIFLLAITSFFFY
jgi:RNA polymerase sigma factor (sigma-70 family)